MHAIALALCAMVLSGSNVFAQGQQVDPEKLPVSLGRIRLKLSVPAEEAPRLKIERAIEVVGVAPPIELWTTEERTKLVGGPSPFGPPTQRDILDLNAPYKRYPMDLNALMRWLSEKLKAE